jgi:hypothetical protein
MAFLSKIMIVFYTETKRFVNDYSEIYQQNSKFLIASSGESSRDIDPKGAFLPKHVLGMVFRESKNITIDLKFIAILLDKFMCRCYHFFVGSKNYQ